MMVLMLHHFFTLSKFKYRNKDFLLLLSDVISLNPGSSHMNQPSGNNECDFFKAREIYFFHINIGSLLPKIEEIHHITCLVCICHWYFRIKS